jgi:putative endonuclease
MVWLYILECRGGSYYTGTTRRSLEDRVGEHNAGRLDGYTARRRPVRLVFSEDFTDPRDAIAAERQVKGWTRAKKLALIEGRFDDLAALARRRVR